MAERGVSQVYPSERGSLGRGGEVTYQALGYRKKDDALTAVLGEAAETYSGQPLIDVQFEEQGVSTLDAWRITLVYGGVRSSLLPVGTRRWRTSIAAGTKNIKVAKQHIGDFGINGDPAPNFGGLINVNENGEPEGVDVVSPTFEMVCEMVRPAREVTLAHQVACFLATGRFNATTFRGFAVGEVLFMGAELVPRGGGEEPDYDCTYKFAVSPTIVDGTIDTLDEGGAAAEIGPFDAYGWDYVWARSSRREDTAARALATHTTSAHVERLYDSVDFDVLGLRG